MCNASKWGFCLGSVWGNKLIKLSAYVQNTIQYSASQRDSLERFPQAATSWNPEQTDWKKKNLIYKQVIKPDLLLSEIYIIDRLVFQTKSFSRIDHRIVRQTSERQTPSNRSRSDGIDVRRIHRNLIQRNLKSIKKKGNILWNYSRISTKKLSVYSTEKNKRC